MITHAPEKLWVGVGACASHLCSRPRVTVSLVSGKVLKAIPWASKPSVTAESSVSAGMIEPISRVLQLPPIASERSSAAPACGVGLVGGEVNTVRNAEASGSPRLPTCQMWSCDVRSGASKRKCHVHGQVPSRISCSQSWNGCMPICKSK